MSKKGGVRKDSNPSDLNQKLINTQEKRHVKTRNRI